MGKRKSRAKPPLKKRMDKLDTVFSCHFCNHGTSVECRIDMKNLIGEATCRIRQENFSTTITGMELIAYVQQPEYSRINLAGTGALEGSSSGWFVEFGNSARLKFSAFLQFKKWVDPKCGQLTGRIWHPDSLLRAVLSSNLLKPGIQLAESEYSILLSFLEISPLFNTYKQALQHCKIIPKQTTSRNSLSTSNRSSSPNSLNVSAINENEGPQRTTSKS